MGDSIPHPDATEIDRVATLLIDEWCRAEKIARHDAPLSAGDRLNISYVATFADMARVVIADRRVRWPDPDESVVTAALAKAQALFDWDAYSEDAKDDDGRFACIECKQTFRIECGYDPAALCNGCVHGYLDEIAGVLPKLASERTMCLEELAKAKAEVVALTERRDALLALAAKLTQTEPLPEEVKGAIDAQRALIAEVGTLRARNAELERELADREAAKASWQPPQAGAPSLRKRGTKGRR